MKCIYKEPMDYFYLTKDNHEEFLNKIYNKYKYIISIEEKCIKVDTCFGCDIFYFNRYYVSSYGFKTWTDYSKEEFEEIFEVIE